MVESLGLSLSYVFVFALAVVSAVTFAAFLTSFLKGLKSKDKNRYSDGENFLHGIITFALGLMLAIITVGLIPFESSYWNNYSVRGEVSSIKSAFTTTSNDVASTFVVTFVDSDTPYVFSDPRILTQEGRNIEALCTKRWVYLAADEWSCKIREADFTRQGSK